MTTFEERSRGFEEGAATGWCQYPGCGEIVVVSKRSSGGGLFCQNARHDALSAYQATRQSMALQTGDSEDLVQSVERAEARLKRTSEWLHEAIDHQRLLADMFSRRLAEAEGRSAHAEATVAAADAAIQELTTLLATTRDRAESDAARAGTATALVEALRVQLAVADELRVAAETEARSLSAGRVSIGAAAHDAATRAVTAELARTEADADVRALTEALRVADARAHLAVGAEDEANRRAQNADAARARAEKKASDALHLAGEADAKRARAEAARVETAVLLAQTTGASSQMVPAAQPEVRPVDRRPPTEKRRTGRPGTAGETRPPRAAAAATPGKTATASAQAAVARVRHAVAVSPSRGKSGARGKAASPVRPAIKTASVTPVPPAKSKPAAKIRQAAPKARSDELVKHSATRIGQGAKARVPTRRVAAATKSTVGTSARIAVAGKGARKAVTRSTTPISTRRATKAAASPVEKVVVRPERIGRVPVPRVVGARPDRPLRAPLRVTARPGRPLRAASRVPVNRTDVNIGAGRRLLKAG